MCGTPQRSRRISTDAAATLIRTTPNIIRPTHSNDMTMTSRTVISSSRRLYLPIGHWHVNRPRPGSREVGMSPAGPGENPVDEGLRGVDVGADGLGDLPGADEMDRVAAGAKGLEVVCHRQ